MKKESIEKLSEIYNAINQYTDSEHGHIAKLIEEVLRAESNDAKLGKLNVYDFASKDQRRPVLSGVYHEEGYMVASDGFMLIAVKAQYESELEGKVVNRDGSICEGTYPRWRTVIPKEDGYQKFKIDKAKFLGWLKDVRAEYKALYGKCVKFSDQWFVGVGGTYFKAEFFNKFLTAMDYLGTDEMLVRDSRAAYSQTEKGVVLIMPMRIREFDEEDRVCELTD